ncbi:hypothetical protein GQ53DRAFT_803696 [Thozetella sp. PMI_491]|nr:hypothetical protein GQ53DRAFT_803696 [Thozetella sp. PMI_491]
MAPEPREKLLRVQSARSTTGCRTCKSRRVKCDEDRPWCQRCLKARVPCHYDAPQVPQVANKFIIFTVPRPLPENPDLLTAPFYSALWVEGIFQIAARHDFVMSALVALSSMHESFCQQGELRERYQATAIYHYTKAMGDIALISHFESSIYAVLVSSVIFYSIESLRGCFYPALQHIQSGVRIIGEQRQRLALDSSQPSQLAVTLDNIFSGDCFDRFDVDIARLLDLAEAFLQGEDQGLGESQYAFSLSLGIIPPLFMLAYRCSYAPLRDKSLELLASKRRREGVWDSGIALRLAQQAFTFKSQVAATGSNYNVQISNISFVSETTCQMDFVIVEPMAPVWFSIWESNIKYVAGKNVSVKTWVFMTFLIQAEEMAKCSRIWRTIYKRNSRSTTLKEGILSLSLLPKLAGR